MTQISNSYPNLSRWQTVIILTLAVWLGGSLILDLVVMPGMFAAGMMTQPGFAAAGYAIFEWFNHVELLSAAVILTGILALTLSPSAVPGSRWAIALSSMLLMIALVYTYGLTPEMSALGLSLNYFEPTAAVPAEMGLMHGSYWVLEVSKVAIGALLLRLCYTTPAAQL